MLLEQYKHGTFLRGNVTGQLRLLLSQEEVKKALKQAELHSSDCLIAVQVVQPCKAMYNEQKRLIHPAPIGNFNGKWSVVEMAKGEYSG